MGSWWNNNIFNNGPNNTGVAKVLGYGVDVLAIVPRGVSIIGDTVFGSSGPPNPANVVGNNVGATSSQLNNAVSGTGGALKPPEKP